MQLSTILAKTCGTRCLSPNCCNIRSLPPSPPPPPPPPPMQCWTTRRQAFPYEQHCMGEGGGGGGGGGGGEVGFGPKKVCFHVKNWSMVEAVHSASLSHIILARIVVLAGITLSPFISQNIHNTHTLCHCYFREKTPRLVMAGVENNVHNLTVYPLGNRIVALARRWKKLCLLEKKTTMTLCSVNLKKTLPIMPGYGPRPYPPLPCSEPWP